MRFIALMADYHAFPLWERSPGAPSGDIDPDTLPLGEALIADVKDWGRQFSDPGFPQSEDAEAAWVNRGRQLCRRLQGELGTEFDVSYEEDRSTS